MLEPNFNFCEKTSRVNIVSDLMIEHHYNSCVWCFQDILHMDSFLICVLYPNFCPKHFTQIFVFTSLPVCPSHSKLRMSNTESILIFSALLILIHGVTVYPISWSRNLDNYPQSLFFSLICHIH